MPDPKKMQAALKKIINALGPETAGCPENTCAGCHYEMQYALDLAKETLNPIPCDCGNRDDVKEVQWLMGTGAKTHMCKKCRMMNNGCWRYVE